MSLIGALAKAAKAGETAKKTAPFYSAVDEALANLPRPKGTGEEFYKELTKQAGVKKAELADRKLEQAFKARGKMTKEEAQQVLKDNPPPKLQERVRKELTDKERQEMIDDNMERYDYRRYNDVPSSRMQEWHDEIDAEDVQHAAHRLPGGSNYREILLKLPKEFSDIESRRMMSLEANLRRGELPESQMQELLALQAKKQNSQDPYYSSHYLTDPNLLAHMRVIDRKGPNGEKVLHVEEIQSDWHQKGRKSGYHNEAAYKEARQKADEIARAAGFNDAFHAAEGWKGHGMPSAKPASDLLDEASKFKSVNGVPDAPFKKNWHELAMKRLLNYAADNGYDSIAITPGAEQANRYKLSNRVEKIDYFKNVDGTFNFVAYSKQNQPLLHKTDIGLNEMSDFLGKDVAQKISDATGAPRPTNLAVGKIGNNYEIVDQYGETVEKFKTKRDAEAKLGQIQSGAGSLSGIELDIGGEGMKGFYDKMLPDYLNTFGKSYGAKVEPMSIDMGGFKVNRDSYPLPYRLELANSPDIISRFATAEEAWAEAQRMGQVPLHNFRITPEMREQIKQKGLPLYQQVGIPTVGAGAASQTLQPEEETGLAGGGSVAKMAALAKLAKMREEMTPRAEAVKALIARDENRYLRDVVPNSLTKESIEQEIARMKAKEEAFKPDVKEAKGGRVRMTTNRDTMFMELSNKKLKRK
jgi:hypothetical protein